MPLLSDGTSSVSRYHARDWAEGKTEDQIREEIAFNDARWSSKKPFPFPLNANDTYSRIQELKDILAERARSNTVTQEEQ